MAGNVLNIEARLQADSRKYRKEMDRAQKETKEFGTTAKKATGKADRGWDKAGKEVGQYNRQADQAKYKTDKAGKSARRAGDVGGRAAKYIKGLLPAIGIVGGVTAAYFEWSNKIAELAERGKQELQSAYPAAKRLVQISGSLEEFNEKIERSADAAAQFGQSLAKSQELLFSVESAFGGRSKEERQALVGLFGELTRSIEDPQQMANIVAQAQYAIPGAGTAPEIVNQLVAAAGESTENIEGLAKATQKPGPMMKMAGWDYSQLLGLLSVASAMTPGQPEDVGTAVRGLVGKGLQKGTIQGKDIKSPTALGKYFERLLRTEESRKQLKEEFDLTTETMSALSFIANPENYGKIEGRIKQVRAGKAATGTAKSPARRMMTTAQMAPETELNWVLNAEQARLKRTLKETYGEAGLLAEIARTVLMNKAAKQGNLEVYKELKKRQVTDLLSGKDPRKVIQNPDEQEAIVQALARDLGTEPKPTKERVNRWMRPTVPILGVGKRNVTREVPVYSRPIPEGEEPEGPVTRDGYMEYPAAGQYWRMGQAEFGEEFAGFVRVLQEHKDATEKNTDALKEKTQDDTGTETEEVTEQTTRDI